MTKESKPYYLYLHVPFCRTICSYCDFCHAVYRKDAADRWLDALERETVFKEIRPDLKTIYIGGGTPVSLDEAQLERLLGMLDPYRKDCIEYTIEVNPGTLDERKADILVRHGINRVSVGMQTGDDDLLKLLGRDHTAAQTEECVRILRAAGISNISLDLMYSLPRQTIDLFRASIEDALRMEPEHLSLYSLTIEENTVFGRKGYDHLDEDTEADMYELAADLLESRGFRHYEISNFCRPGKESVHNTAYWNYMDFYGISCGASGKENHARYDHTRSLKQYIENPFQTEVTELSPADEKFEMIMMGLRLKQGMNQALYEERFGEPVRARYGRVIGKMKENGLLAEHDGFLKCTEKGFPLLNEILVDFLDD